MVHNPSRSFNHCDDNRSPTQKGHLESLEFLGIKINFNSDKPTFTPSSLYKLRNYDIKFTKIAAQNASALGITEDKVIYLVEHEFTHHINYFLWDLQDYPLPVQQNYIIVLDKIGKSLLIRAIKSSNFNEAQLVSINNLLADYRRLSRYKYRTDSNYVLRPETIGEILETHIEIIRRLIKHYELYREPSSNILSSFASLYLDVQETLETIDDASKAEDLKKMAEELLPSNKVFAYNLVAATKSLKEIDKLTADLDNGFITSDMANREIVLSFENSLQYIHKTINLLFAN